MFEKFSILAVLIYYEKFTFPGAKKRRQKCNNKNISFFFKVLDLEFGPLQI